MVKAGKPTDDVIAELTPHLDEGDIIIDAATRFLLTRTGAGGDSPRRSCCSSGMAVSGGEEGALEGPSIMPGGAKAAWERIAPMVTKMAISVDGAPYPCSQMRRTVSFAWALELLLETVSYQVAVVSKSALTPVIRRTLTLNVKYDQAQPSMTDKRLRIPTRNRMCAAPHSHQARAPVSFTRPNSATALLRPMVAKLP